MTLPDMRSNIDLFSHTNPAFVSSAVYWVCMGYQDATKRNGVASYIAVPWCLVSVALLAPDRVRGSLPKSSTKRLLNLMAEHPDWKYSMPLAVRLWAPAFWAGMRFGIAKGALQLLQGRVSAGVKLGSPMTDTALNLQKKALVIGKMFGNEGSDAGISLALGMEIGR